MISKCDIVRKMQEVVEDFDFNQRSEFINKLSETDGASTGAKVAKDQQVRK